VPRAHGKTVACASTGGKTIARNPLQSRRVAQTRRAVPPGRTDWVPPISGAWPVGLLLGHLLDCLAGFCAVLYAVAPGRLAGLTALRELPVNHYCSPDEAKSRIAAYRAGIDQGFAVLRDADLKVAVPTVFVQDGEFLLTLLLGNLEHFINHKHQLFLYLQLMGVNVRSADLYRFRAG
jgi:DinB superfamily